MRLENCMIIDNMGFISEEWLLMRSSQWHKVLMLEHPALAGHMKPSFCMKCEKNKSLNPACEKLCGFGKSSAAQTGLLSLVLLMESSQMKSKAQGYSLGVVSVLGADLCSHLPSVIFFWHTVGETKRVGCRGRWDRETEVSVFCDTWDVGIPFSPCSGGAAVLTCQTPCPGRLSDCPGHAIPRPDGHGYCSALPAGPSACCLKESPTSSPHLTFPLWNLLFTHIFLLLSLFSTRIFPLSFCFL